MFKSRFYGPDATSGIPQKAGAGWDLWALSPAPGSFAHTYYTGLISPT
jgi:hypothetical protein